jgi:hypothetical protein
MRGWPLVGRAEELRVIEDTVRTDHGGGVAIAGPPGVGKTRLAHEAAELASTWGWSVRWVVGTVASCAVPMGAFAGWTNGLDGNPLRLVHQVVDALAAGSNETP